MSFQRASALLSALLMMAFITLTVTEIGVTLQQQLTRTRYLIDADTRYLAAEGVFNWAMDVLSHPTTRFVAQDSTGTIARFPKAYATLYPSLTLTGQLIDLQSRFNLNTASNPHYQLILDHLLHLREPTWSASQRHHFSDQLAHFLAPSPPMPAQLLLAVTHYPPLRDATLFSKLDPFITALPTETPINLNTASQTVFMALGEGLSETQAKTLLALRAQQKGFRSLTHLQQTLQMLHIPADTITLNSRYFLVDATVTQGTVTQTWSLELERLLDDHQHVSFRYLRIIPQSN